MFLRSVILRSPVPGGGLKVMNYPVLTKDISMRVLVRSLTEPKIMLVRAVLLMPNDVKHTSNELVKLCIL